MSAAIKAGDLVMVVRASSCCCSTKKLGRIFMVRHVVKSTIHTCLRCGHREVGAIVALEAGREGCMPYRLKKIDPPAEGDSLPTRRELETTT